MSSTAEGPPVVKTISLLKAKAGLTPDEFFHYYETKHAPLIRSLFPSLLDYRRNYIDHSKTIAATDGSFSDCDVITELWFTDQAAYQNFIFKVIETQVGDMIAADEEEFLDRGKSRHFVVKERAGV